MVRSLPRGIVKEMRLMTAVAKISLDIYLMTLPVPTLTVYTRGYLNKDENQDFCWWFFCFSSALISSSINAL